MAEFEIKKTEISETATKRYVEGEKDTFTRRRGSKDAIIVTHRESMTFEVKTPTGKTEVTYGKGGYGGDSLHATFRSENISVSKLRGDSWNTFEKKVADIEKEHQTKKSQAAARKEMAKNPIPCVVILGGTPKNERDGAKYVPPAYEKAFVRGIDQRNGSALVTRLDGTKEAIRAARVLRELDRDELRELELADQRVTTAVTRAANAKLPRLGDALLEIGFSADLTVHYDPAADARWAEVEGERFVAESETALIRQITLWALRRSGEFKYVAAPKMDAYEAIDAVEDYEFAATAFRSMDEWNERNASTFAKEVAYGERDALVNDLLFDLSLFAEAGRDEAAVAKSDESVEAKVIRNIGKAPDVTPEWED